MNSFRRSVIQLWQKQFLYGLCAVLWLTGIIWLYFRYIYKTDEGQFQTHPAQSISLIMHGFAAAGFLIIFGSLLFHIPQGWRQTVQRPTGISLLTICLILILTGWGLYYLGQQREMISLIHWCIGVLLPVLLFCHVWRLSKRINRN
jgi:hypothetical protein